MGKKKRKKKFKSQIFSQINVSQSENINNIPVLEKREEQKVSESQEQPARKLIKQDLRRFLIVAVIVLISLLGIVWLIKNTTLIDSIL